MRETGHVAHVRHCSAPHPRRFMVLFFPFFLPSFLPLSTHPVQHSVACSSRRWRSRSQRLILSCVVLCRAPTTFNQSCSPLPSTNSAESAPIRRAVTSAITSITAWPTAALSQLYTAGRRGRSAVAAVGSEGVSRPPHAPPPLRCLRRFLFSLWVLAAARSPAPFVHPTAPTINSPEFETRIGRRRQWQRRLQLCL